MECHQVRNQSGIAAAKGGFFPSGLYLWAIGIVLIIATLAGSAATVWHLRRDALEDNLQHMANLGVVLAEQTARYIQVVDVALQEIVARSAALGVTTPEQFAQLFGIATGRTKSCASG